jgi:hypothetical protein
MSRNRRHGASCQRSTGSRSAGGVACSCDCVGGVTGDSGSAGGVVPCSDGNRFDAQEPPIAFGREHAGSRRLARPAIAIGSGPNSQIGK